MRRLLGGCICVALLCIVSLSLSAQDAAKQVLTVLDFKVDGVSEKEMINIISLLSSALFESGRFTIIDVTQRDLLLKEQEFSTSDCTDDSCQLEIGKLLSAEEIVVGNLGKVGTRYMISAKMLDTETGSTLAVADGVYTSLDQLVDGLGAIAAKLSGQPEPSGTGTAGKKTGSTSARRVLSIASLAAGVGAGAVGGWLLYDGIVNGRTAITATEAEYEAATSTEALAAWETWSAAVKDARTRIYLGIGLASGGVVLSGLGTYLAVTTGWRTAESTVSIRLAPVPEGALLSMTVRY